MKRTLRTLIAILVLPILSYYPSMAQDQLVDGFTPKPYFVKGLEQPVINLNGQWEFNQSPPASFWKKPRVKKLEWSTIKVPGEWVMQGYTVEVNTPAAYAKTFFIPENWKGQRTMLKCDGVYSLTRVYCNGKLIGGHEGGFTPFELDLSGVVKYGKDNTLVLSVQNESLADTLASATQYAAHQLGGISRKIVVYSTPQVHLEWCHFETDLDEDYQNAMLNINLRVKNASKKIVTGETVSIILVSKDIPGETVAKSWSVDPLRSDESLDMHLTFPVIDPEKWDPEHPHLYDVFIELKEKEIVIEKISKVIGFREIEVVGNQVFVNGRPIKLHGVDRHEVHPTKGRSLSMEEWKADAKLFKEANVNYIRTSHYPPAEEFIEQCDSIGLFVELESPMCWVGHGANTYWQKENPGDSKFSRLIHRQVRETIAQYRNHPSILIWSMANESTWSPIWESVLEMINKIEPTRPVSFHDQAYGGYNNFGSKNTQIANIHYPGPNGPAIAWKFDRPLLFGEYAHLNTYNRQEIVTDPGVRDAWGRGLESMWENMYHSKGCLGGAIWSGIDDVFYLPDGRAVGYGEWGPIDGWRRPKPEYWHLKKIYSPIKIVSRHLNLPDAGQPIVIPVENRFLFSNLDEVIIKWSWGKHSGQATTDLGPGQSGLLKIWPDFYEAEKDELKLVFVAPQGYVIDEYAFHFGSDEKVDEVDQEPVVPILQVLERKATVVMGDSEWLFDASTGKLRSVISHNEEVISSGPELMMLPLKTGPCNTEHSLFIQPLNDPCSNWSGAISATGKDGDGVFIEVEGSYTEADIKLRYLFSPDSKVKITYELVVKEDINPRQIGLVFGMPFSFSNLAWKRNGQWSTYPETHLGRTKGTTTPFAVGKNTDFVFGQKPNWIWEDDHNSMGSNDFRATRDKLIWASLTDKKGHGIRMDSDGTGAFRAFLVEGGVHFLAASFSTAGGDLFFSSHLASERHPLKAGDTFKGELLLTVL